MPLQVSPPLLCASPSLEALLSAAPEESSPESLLLALKLWRKMPAPLLANCKLLPSSGSPKDLFTLQHLELLLPALKVQLAIYLPMRRSSQGSGHPPTHPPIFSSPCCSNPRTAIPASTPCGTPCWTSSCQVFPPPPLRARQVARRKKSRRRRPRRGCR